MLTQQPNNADAIALLSSVALAQGDRAEALAQIQKALAIDPNRSNFHAALALIQASDPAQEASAEAELQKAISLDPKNAMAHLVLSGILAEERATCRVRVSRPPRLSISSPRTSARVSTSSASNSVPATRPPPKPRSCRARICSYDTPQGAELLWDYYARTGQVDQAASAYANLVAKHPTSVPLKVTYAHILIQQKNYDAATKVSDELMKSNGNDPQVAVLNGMLLLHAGKVNDAFIALQKAEKNSPDNVPVKLWLAQAAQAKGDLNAAEQNFQAAVNKEPNNLDAARGLASVANQLKDYNLLMQVATSTLAHNPDFSDAYLWKGIAEIHQQQPDQAAADLQTAISKNPNNAAAMQELGALRLSQEQTAAGQAVARTGARRQSK